MLNLEISKKTPYFKGGTLMRKYTLIAVLVMALLLVTASFAAAAPGNYPPDNTSVPMAAYGVTWYVNVAGGVYNSVYLFLNPYAGVAGTDPRTNIGGWAWTNANRSGEMNVPMFVYEGSALFSTLQRNVAGQLVHTDFQLNTNSCASCHMTHTAQSRDLLFRNGIYATCVACHDGTLGFLNVFAFPGEGNPTSSFGGSIAAGTFGARYGRNASIHLPTNTVNLSAAPGGNRTNSTTGGADGTSGSSAWTSSFNCSSCHAPHGSYSIRLLHFNPANISLRWRIGAVATHVYNPAPTVSVLSGQEVQSGGLWDDGANLTSTWSTSANVYYVAYTNWPRPLSASMFVYEPWIYAYPAGTENIGPTGNQTRVARLVTRIWYEGFYNPNSHGGPASGTVLPQGLLNRFFDIKYGSGIATQTVEQRTYMINFLESTATAAHSVGINPATGAPFPALTAAERTGLTAIGAGNFNEANLRIDIGGVIRITAGTNPVTGFALPQYSTNYIDSDSYSGGIGRVAAMGGSAGSAQAISATAGEAPYNLFCAACHTDYLMGSASGQSGAGAGIYSKAYRHTINRGASGGATMPVRATGNRLMCISCHFAHGADSGFMSLADGTLVDEATLSTGTQAGSANPHVGTNDLNPSSALKRYVNMAVCWTCHANSSAQLIKNATWYWNGYTTDGRGDW